jgi:hypothetical protein
MNNASKKTRKTPLPAEAAAKNTPPSPIGAVGALGWGGDWLAAISAAAGVKTPPAAKTPRKAPLKKAKPMAPQSPDDLLQAIHIGSLKMLKDALESGVDPNFMIEHGTFGHKNFHASTPLARVVCNGWLEAAEALAAHGADEGLARQSYVERGDLKWRAERERAVAARDATNWETLSRAETLAFVVRPQKKRRRREKSGQLRDWLLGLRRMASRPQANGPAERAAMAFDGKKSDVARRMPPAKEHRAMRAPVGQNLGGFPRLSQPRPGVPLEHGGHVQSPPFC